MDKNDLLQIRQKEETGFILHNNIKLSEIDKNHCSLKVNLDANSQNIWGSAHGGLIFTLADTAAGALGRFLHPGVTTTTNATIQYFRSAKNSKCLIATSKVQKLGKNISFFEVNITNEMGVQLANASITMYFFDQST